MRDLAEDIADAIAEKGGHLNKSSDILIMIACESAELFHNQYGEAFARVRVSSGDPAAVRTLKVRSRLFRIWLSNQYWQRHGKAASSQSLKSALNVCEAHAVFDGPLHELHSRVATYQGAIYYDLSDSKIVKVTEDGWNVLDCKAVPPLFQRYPHQRPQVEPARDGDLRLFLKYLNLQYEDDGSLSDEQVLTLVTLPTILIENISHPIIVFAGPQGSAKTTFMKLLRLLLDPSAAPLLTLGDSQRELAQQLQHNCVP